MKISRKCIVPLSIFFVHFLTIISTKAMPQHFAPPGSLDNFDFSWLDGEYDEAKNFPPRIDLFPYFKKDFGLRKHNAICAAELAMGIPLVPMLGLGVPFVIEAVSHYSLTSIYKLVTAALVLNGSLADNHMPKSEADKIIEDFYSWYVKKHRDTLLSKHEFNEQIVRAYYLRALSTSCDYMGEKDCVFTGDKSFDLLGEVTLYRVLYKRIFSGNTIASLESDFMKMKDLRVRLKNLNYDESYLYGKLRLRKFIEVSERDKNMRYATALREKKNKVDNQRN